MVRTVSPLMASLDSHSGEDNILMSVNVQRNSMVPASLSLTPAQDGSGS